jgi:hypothetical protein
VTKGQAQADDRGGEHDANVGKAVRDAMRKPTRPDVRKAPSKAPPTLDRNSAAATERVKIVVG